MKLGEDFARDITIDGRTFVPGNTLIERFSLSRKAIGKFADQEGFPPHRLYLGVRYWDLLEFEQWVRDQLGIEAPSALPSPSEPEAPKLEFETYFVAKWEAMASAPRDGKQILVTNGEIVFKAFWAGDDMGWCSEDIVAAKEILGSAGDDTAPLYADDDLCGWMRVPPAGRSKSEPRKSIVDPVAISALSDADLNQLGGILGVSN